MFRQRHPERQREYVKTFRLRHPDRIKSYRDKHIRLVEEAKSKPCADCGKSYPPYVMDFDHVRGEKHDCVGHLKVNEPSKLLEEISKCDVVCSNCHRERTYGATFRARKGV